MAASTKHSPSFRHSPLIILVIATLVAILSRFHHLAGLLHWTLDEEYWAYIPHNIAAGYHLPLIGGPISGTGVHMGPLFVWLISPVFFLGHSQPLAIAAFVSTLGVLTTVLIYFLLRSKLGRPVAALTSLFYATSTLVTLYDRKYWNASPIPLLSLITLYIVSKLSTKPRSTKISFALAFTLALAINAHFTGLALVVFAAIYLFLNKVPAKTCLLIAATFILLHAPLAIFDLRHDFSNTRSLITLLSTTPSSHSASPPHLGALFSTTFARLVYTPARDISDELTLCTQLASQRSIPPPTAYILAIPILAFALFKLNRHNPFSLLIATNLGLVTLYGFLAPAGSFYVGQLAEYYLLPSFISFLVFAASFSMSTYRRFPILAASLIFFLVIINLHTSLNLTHSHGYAAKANQVQTALAALRQQSFHLNVIGHPCQIYGYRYLFTVAGSEPSSSYLDTHFGWLYQDYLPITPPSLKLTLDADSGGFTISPVSSTSARLEQTR